MVLRSILQFAPSEMNDEDQKSGLSLEQQFLFDMD
jgi:hypothetical protein